MGNLHPKTRGSESDTTGGHLEPKVNSKPRVSSEGEQRQGLEESSMGGGGE